MKTDSAPLCRSRVSRRRYPPTRLNDCGEDLAWVRAASLTTKLQIKGHVPTQTHPHDVTDSTDISEETSAGPRFCRLCRSVGTAQRPSPKPPKSSEPGPYAENTFPTSLPHILRAVDMAMRKLRNTRRRDHVFRRIRSFRIPQRLGATPDLMGIYKMTLIIIYSGPWRKASYGPSKPFSATFVRISTQDRVAGKTR